MRTRLSLVFAGIVIAGTVFVLQGILPENRDHTTATSGRVGSTGRAMDSSLPSATAAPSTTVLQDKVSAVVEGDIAPAATFNATRALGHIKYLAKTIGPRPAGGKNERLASYYIRDELKAYGLSTTIQTFKLPNGQNSYNVVGYLPGTSGKTVILGAHFDSKGGPGANDNASGTGVLLENARVAATGGEPPHSLYFIFFGAEERIGKNRNDHHFGSRHYARNMTRAQAKNTLAMVNVDMVGKGTVLAVRSLRAKPAPLANVFLGLTKGLGVKGVYKQGKDDSDYEAFENAGIPSVWLQWRTDNSWHTPKDTFDRIGRMEIDATGKVVAAYLESL
ncbi:MAG: M28 family metallopeptidase [Actinomycetota bacterium]|nr:M28 family metallopeptidase [Actinomycetota bacterium]